MTIKKALEALDSSCYNTCSQAQKVAWLSLLDSMVKTQILDLYVPDEGCPAFSGYDETTDLDTELLVPAPFDEMYLHWLEARVDYGNGEIIRFNNANAMFETVRQRFCDHYHRSHTPLSAGAFH